MTRVLHVTGSMPSLKCGVGFYANRLLDYLPEGFDVLTTAGLSTHRGARKTFYTPDWKLRRIFELLSVCSKGGYDIIHIQYPTKGYGRQLGINKLPYLLRVFGKSKTIVTLHEYHGSGLLGKVRNFVTCLPVHKIFVSNPYDYESLPKILRNKAEIVPIGSNVPIARKNPSKFSQIVKEAEFNTTKKIAVYFGFPYPNKGVDVAIEAARLGGFQLLLLTDFDKKDPYQNDLADQAKSAIKSGAKIYVAGFLEDTKLSEVMQECDYFVLPQPLPLTAKSSTAITAAVHGLAVISKSASKPLFNKPYINDKNSILLDKITPKILADTVEHAPEATKFNKELDKLADYFAWDKIALKHIQVYGELSK